MDSVVHFEISAEDMKRMSKFYTDAFGWKTKQLGEDMGNYVLVTTTEVDDNMMPKKSGAINGGFFLRTKDRYTHHPSMTISVEDINKSIKKVENAGGKMIGEVMEIPKIGLIANFYDTEGNRISMMQPFMK